MEDEQMEKTWEDFWTSGKVTDYLSYRNSTGEQTTQQKEQQTDGAGTRTDGNGFKYHAN